jgi:hypothetical protein
MATTTQSSSFDLRSSVQRVLRDAWIASRSWVQPRLVSTVKRIEHALGVLPQRAWFDRVDTASDQSFPASDPPAHSSPRAGAPNGHD